jgi:hypothetical protein
VVWTTDSSRVPCDHSSPGLGENAMSDTNDPRDDQLELECLRLASDLKQLAKITLDPDLTAHCLRIAQQWSGEGDEPIKDDTGIDRGMVH